jgi:SAM-dependent methyltransferase
MAATPAPTNDVTRHLQVAYTLAAGRYARWVAPRFRPIARELLAWPTPAPGPGLDVGSGTGGAIAEWRRLQPVARLVAVDLTPAMLARGSAPYRLAADAAALPLAEQTFRTVVSVFALHHLPAPVAALREWRRVLADGGELRVATWAANPRTLWDVFDDALAERGAAERPGPPGRALDDEAVLADAVAEAGFADVAVRRLAARFDFADATAYWRWRTAFPGAARAVAALAPPDRRALHQRVGERLVAWPGPLVSHHAVLLVRARRA